MSRQYHANPALGSTNLGAFIEHQDYVDLGVEPTGFMEVGNIFEKRVEEEVTENQVYFDEYFESDMNLKAESAAWKKILPLFERDEPPAADEIAGLYVYTDKGELHTTHKNLHRALDQIKTHGFRRLVPADMVEKTKRMLENFKRVELPGFPVSLFKMLRGYNARFQVERFWKHQSGQECKMKSDIELFYQDTDGAWHGLLIDLKVTSTWAQFVQNWKRKYIWQYMHYSDGFGRLCRENGLIQEPMLYIICESSAPYLVNSWELAQYEIEALRTEYNEHVENFYNWDQAGRPAKGYRKKQTVDRYGRNAREE